MEPRSVRLTNDLRYKFINRVITTLMPVETCPNLQGFIKKHREQVYKETYGMYQESLKALPEWMTTKTSRFTIKLGSHKELDIDMGREFLGFPTDINYYGKAEFGVPDIGSNHEVSKAYVQFQLDRQEWNTKRNTLEDKIRKIANSCNTTGQLYKVWPKAKEYSHIFPTPSTTTRSQWTPQYDGAELDLEIEMTKVTVNKVEEN